MTTLHDECTDYCPFMARSAPLKHSKGISIPLTTPPAGTALSPRDWPQNQHLPKLFTPITIGETAKVEFKNRIWVSPMCQYSCESKGEMMGVLTPHQFVELGTFAQKGAAMVMTEALAVEPRGRISPQDSGLWNDRQKDALESIIEFIKAHGARAGVQIAHAGRKASTLAPFLSDSTSSPHLACDIASKEGDGWPDDVIAPSAIPHESGKYPHPKEMGTQEFKQVLDAWKEAAVRAVDAGADLIEVHSAHGYLLHNFLSPISNTRTDNYGGSLENRMRFPLEIIQVVRSVVPDSVVLALRISGTEWSPRGERDEKTQEWLSWGIEQSKIYIGEAIKLGIDVADISSGGNDPKQVIKTFPSYQVPLAEAIKKSLPEDKKIPISTVGLITNGTQAESILKEGKADIISVAREYLRHPDLCFDWAMELGCVVNVPCQNQRAWTRMFKKLPAN
ncbi:NADH:flavin oxidoreductase/NADH oxidase [Sporobolomyces salmoneus]|uniref:NADH:flavin oxidoreductase/NADH oxidase n=1 Tax=Sporobolomyces salmoneus TaxID=183962 RepID=UPI00316DD13A